MTKIDVAELLDEDEPGPARRRRDRQRRRIFAEAVKLFHENGGEEGGGHDKTTVEAIADRSDISVRSFFRYFQTKTYVIYVDVPSAMEDHVALTERLLTKLPPAQAILAATVIQLTEALNDKDDVARIVRASTSKNFVERRGSFSFVWRNKLAAVIEPHLGIKDPAKRRLEAKVIAASSMTLRDIALEEWALTGGGKDLVGGIEAVIACFKRVLADSVPPRVSPQFDRRR